MSKAVLMSIQPKWCEKIANGKKTIEVRKTRPKLETPFKCYIYCTKDGLVIYGNGKQYVTDSCEFLKGSAVEAFENSSGFCKWNGKVIGDFVCDRIEDIELDYEFFGKEIEYDLDNKQLSGTCLTRKSLRYYGQGSPLYGWHISQLKIYDKPKELSEFFHYCGDNPKCDGCEAHYYSNTECGKEDYCCSIIDGCKALKRPFQSWGYVEELQE